MARLLLRHGRLLSKTDFRQCRGGRVRSSEKSNYFFGCGCAICVKVRQSRKSPPPAPAILVRAVPSSKRGALVCAVLSNATKHNGPGNDFRREAMPSKSWPHLKGDDMQRQNEPRDFLPCRRVRGEGNRGTLACEHQKKVAELRHTCPPRLTNFSSILRPRAVAFQRSCPILTP